MDCGHFITLLQGNIYASVMQVRFQMEPCVFTDACKGWSEKIVRKKYTSMSSICNFLRTEERGAGNKAKLHNETWQRFGDRHWQWTTSFLVSFFHIFLFLLSFLCCAISGLQFNKQPFARRRPLFCVFCVCKPNPVKCVQFFDGVGIFPIMHCGAWLAKCG